MRSHLQKAVPRHSSHDIFGILCKQSRLSHRIQEFFSIYLSFLSLCLSQRPAPGHIGHVKLRYSSCFSQNDLPS